jgi:hypothetical protein
MAKYRLFPDGVYDTETNECIPEEILNRHWRDFQKWESEGNTPDPEV